MQTHIRLGRNGDPPLLCDAPQPAQSISFRHFRESIHPDGKPQHGHIERFHEPICPACIRNAWNFISGPIDA